MKRLLRRWFLGKMTIIIAPGKGSRASHLHLSYPFLSFLSLLLIGVLIAGIYFADTYIGYSKAIRTNRALVQERDYYSQQVEETLDMLEKVKDIESNLRGMLEMGSVRDIIENYPVGGSEGEVISALPHSSDIFERYRFDSNVAMVRRDVWEQEQSLSDIEGFIAQKKEMLLSTPSIWPIFGYITSGYGWRTHPIRGNREFHRAIDMYSPLEKNTPIRATARGRVVVAGWSGSYGRLVVVDHGNGFSTRYAHCSNIIVEQGDRVEQGQIIAYVGRSGTATGNHVHYEVWYRGKPVNPMDFVRGR